MTYRLSTPQLHIVPVFFSKSIIVYVPENAKEGKGRSPLC